MVQPFKFQAVLLMPHRELDAMVEEVYGRRYRFQQQDDCKDSGTHEVTVPIEYPENYENDTIPEVVNGDKMGVSFAAWLARDPNAWSGAKDAALHVSLFWARNFYPHMDMVLNDLHAKGLLQAGEYVIKID